MSNKRVQFDLEDEQEEDFQESKVGFKKKFKHTLDSDESDDEIEAQNKDRLNEGEFKKKYEFIDEDYENKEDLFRDGGITITPFNIKDELKEGHFDSEGTFIFNKEREQIKDHWIDNIDWQKVKDLDEAATTTKRPSNDEDTTTIKINKEECLRKLVELMNPNETVQKAIQRLGKSKLNKNANRNKNRQRVKNQSGNSKKTEELSKEEQEDHERKQKLNSLIEMSNKLLSDGDMNIYETKFETLNYQLEETVKKQTEALDIFAD